MSMFAAVFEPSAPTARTSDMSIAVAPRHRQSVRPAERVCYLDYRLPNDVSRLA
jgi:hypothetical protein